MHRRQFLRNGGLVLGGLGIIGAAPVGASDRINVGVIGTGVRGQQLIQALMGLPGFRVSACCDVLPFRLEAAQALLDGTSTAYVNYRQLLEDRNIDAVVVATHFSEHYPVVMDAISADKHVYCEKSMIKGIEETMKVVDKARDSKRIFQTGFQYRDSPLYRAVARMIVGGEIGELSAINCQWNRNGNWRRPLPDPRWERQINWRMYREYSGGLVAELSAHQMDFCNQVVAGVPERIHGVGGIDYWKDGRETYDNIHIVCRYGSGVTTTFSSLTANSLGGYRISVLGDRGSIELTTRKGWYFPELAEKTSIEGVDLVSGASIQGSQGAYRSADSRASYQIDAPDVDPTPVALEAFGNAIRENRQPASNVETGARAAIMVQMSLDAMDKEKIEQWKPEYELARLDGRGAYA